MMTADQARTNLARVMLDMNNVREDINRIWPNDVESSRRLIMAADSLHVILEKLKKQQGAENDRKNYQR